MGVGVSEHLEEELNFTEASPVQLKDLLKFLSDSSVYSVYSSEVKAIAEIKTDSNGNVKLSTLEKLLQEIWKEDFEDELEKLRGKLIPSAPEMERQVTFESGNMTLVDDAPDMEEDGGDDWGDGGDDWGDEGDEAVGWGGEGDEGDEAGEDGWDNENDEGKQMIIEEQEPIEENFTRIGEFKVFEEDYLKQQVEKKAEELQDMLGIDYGVSICILRAIKWNVSEAMTKYTDEKVNYPELRKRTRVTFPEAEEEDKKLVRCMFYSGLSRNKVQEKKKKTKVEKDVEKLVKKGKSQSQIFQELRRKYKTPAIMKALNMAMVNMNAGSIELTPCERGRGMVPASKATMLRCGHYGCDDCWREQLQFAVKNGRKCIDMRCQTLVCKKKNCARHRSETGCFCEESIPREMFKKYCKKEELDRYDHWMATRYGEDNKLIRHCPGQDCNKWLEQVGTTDYAKCTCGEIFCFKCHQKPHRPVPCYQYQDWQERSSPDTQHKLFLAANTLPCPKCKVRIEKNKACLHMTCVCGHEFCWACKMPWKNIGHGFYNCTKFKNLNDAKKREEEQRRAVREKGKFDWYNSQIDIIKKEIKEFKAKQEKWEKEMEDRKLTRKDYNFIFDALEILIVAKEQMRNLTIIAFYFKGRSNKWNCGKCTFTNPIRELKCGMCSVNRTKSLPDHKEDTAKLMFEHQREKMVEVTSHLINLFLVKQKVVNAANACDKFIKTLVKDVESGNYINYILERPDDSIKGWFCIKCKKMNKFENTICQTPNCEACQIHAEQKCLRCNPHN